MAGGYPLRINGILIPSSEALYQACRFPHMPNVQKKIIEQHSPMTAKMVSKPHRKDSRPDWFQVRVRIMRWCIRAKLVMHWPEFSQLLLKTDDNPIVEDSRKDEFWGAKRQENGTLVGMNVLGRLLMELREELKSPNSEALRVLDPPPIDNFLLYGEPIKRICFNANESTKLVDPDISNKNKTLWSLFDLQKSVEKPKETNIISEIQEKPKSNASFELSNQKKYMNKYPKRLIEVDLPIKRISAHARREKSIRHGHISTLHIWWARRPLAACRAVTCAALWPDPADELCPQVFRDQACEIMTRFCKEASSSKEIAEKIASNESWNKYTRISKKQLSLDPDDRGSLAELRMLLLDFIADFAAWEASTNKLFLETARALTQSAHEALGGLPGTRPLVVDPFAGGGAIPLEALRVGADAFASDLNPVAVLLNKVVLEYIPKYGQKLADEVRKWGQWVKEQAEQELAQFYPKDPDGATPIAYLWARTITCEGPGCGATVPLIRSLWLAKKSNKSVAVQMIPNPVEKRVDFQIIEKHGKSWFVQGTEKKVDKPNFDGTVARGSATCPCCGYTTPVQSIREQLKKRQGGAADAQLITVREDNSKTGMRSYRHPIQEDFIAIDAVKKELQKRIIDNDEEFSLVPNEPLPIMSGVFNAPIYGHNTWGSLFCPRQQLALTTFVKYIKVAGHKISTQNSEFPLALQVCLSQALDRLADFCTSLCVLNSVGGRGVVHTFGRQALPMVWDFMETNPFNEVGANWQGAIDVCANTIEAELSQGCCGQIEKANAICHPLADDIANGFITDPPYYNAVPYADLSDFFYVWLKRTLPDQIRNLLFASELSPKDEECCEMAGWDPVRYGYKDGSWYEQQMQKAMSEGRRILAPDGIGIIVFAHKSTSGWEAQLQAMIDAGWVMTGSWPIDTERPGRLRAQDSAALASSIHIVCRPREKENGSVRNDEIGDWREVLGELPIRIKEWMARLFEEGVVGADAIFACLGPALEVFSRYSRVEKANGEQVLLREYLEQVWSAVSNEALEQVFKGANTSGFEEDARLTAMWLWTLSADSTNGHEEGKTVSSGGYTLDYDTARKIAQGLGAHLEQLTSLIEVQGDKARLLPVNERTEFLFGKDKDWDAPKGKKKKKEASLFDQLEDFVEEDGGIKINGHKVEKLTAGLTTLDKVHQSMLLFASGRSEAVRRFLVDDGIGADSRFWTLAQALSALYPANTEEKRWVDGVLARKKGLGF